MPVVKVTGEYIEIIKLLRGLMDLLRVCEDVRQRWRPILVSLRPPFFKTTLSLSLSLSGFCCCCLPPLSARSLAASLAALDPVIRHCIEGLVVAK